MYTQIRFIVSLCDERSCFLLQKPHYRDAVQFLKGCELYNVEVTNASGYGKSVDISWTQMSRSLFGNTETYRECTYTEPTGEKLTVFVAKEAGSPPDSFNTKGYKGMLHLGILNVKTNDLGMFFVIHPKDWYPYQHRFVTDSLTSIVHAGAQKAIEGAGEIAAKKYGFVGDVAKELLGQLGNIPASFLGDYLHYLD